MKKEYNWEIKIKNTPTLKRKCKHCTGNRFYCSDKFRMNAQKRYIDVWLIYRCVECDSTYNLTLLSRTKPELIKKELFQKFSGNDKTLAREYAFSLETARRNSVEPDYSSVEYEILHDAISIDDLVKSEHEIIAFKIQTPFEFGLKLSSVIRQCIGLSVNQLNKMVEAKVILTPENYPIKKHKVKNGDCVLLCKEKLKSLYASKIAP